jgi:hypothetical protein
MSPFARPALVTLLASLTLAGVAAAPSQAGADGATWQFAPALAPLPPEGAAPSPYAVALGTVGDIEFWSPNRGVLITGGTQTAFGSGIVPSGVYAYDGVQWHQLSTVCGGATGRIAWAGPDEFWTIADQRPGQVTPNGAQLSSISLCRFQGGRVVGSYAMPLGQPDSYQPMNAAACRTASDCWFGGELVPAPARGAFHLHWDGTSMTEVTSPQDHAVADVATVGSQLFESVALDPTDDTTGEDPSHPPVLHTIAPPGSSTIFRNVVPSDPACAGQLICPPLPDYGRDGSGRPVTPTTLAGLRLSSDWSRAGALAGTPQMWAVAGPSPKSPPAGSVVAHPVALRYSAGSWTQVVPQLGTLPAGTQPVGVAADPGAAAAWIALSADDATARVVRVTAAGEVSSAVALGPDQGVGPRGSSGPIACAAPHDCWLATDRGWLFHLTDGTPLPRDTDPAFADVITFRPADGGVRLGPADAPPPDDSLVNQVPPPVVSVPGLDGPGGGGKQDGGRKTKAKPLVSRSSSRIIHRTTLQLTFTLTARGRVQVIARRKGKVVAQSRKLVLGKGTHRIRLQLDVRRWPTKLDFRATPVPEPAKRR